MAKNFQQAVLDRLTDAVILYCGKRYIASLYMSGYVIEIGIKAELERLSAIEINDRDRLITVIHYLTNKRSSTPNSLENFLNLINQIRNPEDEKVNRKFDLIFNKRSINNHNIKEFLKSLNEWKRGIGESTFNPKWYDISEQCEWSTDLRYGKSLITNDKTELEIAGQGLKIAVRFLEYVVFPDKEENSNMRIKIINLKEQLERDGLNIRFDESTTEQEQIDNINNIGE